MLKKLASILAVAVVAAAFAMPAQAQRGARAGHAGGSAVRMGGFSGGRIAAGHAMRGPGVVSHGYAYRGGVRYGHAGSRYGYRYPGYGYGGYWPYWAWGAAGAFAAEWPYDYYDYGYVAPADDSAVAYCVQRFKSYDPASGTYLGYDGRRHPCP